MKPIKKRPPEKKTYSGGGEAKESKSSVGERGEVSGIMEGTRTLKRRDEDEDVDVALAAFEKKIDKTDPEQVKVSEEEKQGASLSLSLSLSLG